MRFSIFWRLSLSFLIPIMFAYILGFQGITFMQELQEKTETIYE